VELEVRTPNWEEVINTLKNNKASRKNRIIYELWKPRGQKCSTPV